MAQFGVVEQRHVAIVFGFKSSSDLEREIVIHFKHGVHEVIALVPVAPLVTDSTYNYGANLAQIE